MMTDTLVVPRADYSVEDPWAIPTECSPADLRSAIDGSGCEMRTIVAAYRNEELLTVVFSGSDDHLQATHLEHDAPLYEEDVVELFLSTETLTKYFEIEANPLGTSFDAQVLSPERNRATMTVDREWTCNGLFVAVRRAGGLDIVVRVPFAALDQNSPAEGTLWRANFYRIDRHPTRGDEFMAWRPTFKRPPDFHVPDAFGTLRF